MHASTTPSHLPSSKPSTTDTSEGGGGSRPNAHDATSQGHQSPQWATWTKFGRALAPHNHGLPQAQLRHYITGPASTSTITWPMPPKNRKRTHQPRFHDNTYHQRCHLQRSDRPIPHHLQPSEPPSFGPQGARRYLLFRRYPHGSPRHRGSCAHETQPTQHLGIPRLQSLVSFPFAQPLPLHLGFNGQHWWQAHHRHIPILPPCHPGPKHHGHRQDP